MAPHPVGAGLAEKLRCSIEITRQNLPLRGVMGIGHRINPFDSIYRFPRFGDSSGCSDEYSLKQPGRE